MAGTTYSEKRIQVQPGQELREVLIEGLTSMLPDQLNAIQFAAVSFSFIHTGKESYILISYMGDTP